MFDWFVVSDLQTMLIKDVTPNPEDPEIVLQWEALSDLVEVNNTTFQHLASVFTNHQLNMLLACCGKYLSHLFHHLMYHAERSAQSTVCLAETCFQIKLLRHFIPL